MPIVTMMSSLDPYDPEVTPDEIRAEAIDQLRSARDLAKKVRAEAVAKLEEARARVREIAAREEEMAERWAKLLEAENQMAVTPAPIADSDLSRTDPDALVRAAQEEALGIIARAQTEARDIREEAMRLLAVAEGEKAESQQRVQSETERAMVEAQLLRSEAEQEAEQLRKEAEEIESDESAYSKRGRKLPRIGDSATNLLAEMSSLRAALGEDADLKVVGDD